MSSAVQRLPSRFPVGTRFVIEGRGGRIKSRYVEFPDGRHVDLPIDRPAGTASRGRRAAAGASRRGRNFKKS
jgi:hypothetical protein